MKIRHKVLFVNTGVIILFGILMISLFPITRNIYVNNEMNEIEQHLKEIVENRENVFEVIKFGNDSGYLVMTPKRVRGFEAFRPETNAQVIDYERINDITYKIKTSVGHDILMQVNNQTLEKFTQLIMKLLIASFLVLLIIDIVAIYFMMKVIIQPLQKIETKIGQLVHFDFGKQLMIKGNDEFSVLSSQINSLDLTLSQFIATRQAFATSLAHELKTPVAVIQSTIDLYEHQVGDYADYAYSKNIIEKSLERISETAKLSLQIFTHKSLFELKQYDVKNMVLDCIEQCEPLMAKSNLQIQTNLTSTIWKIDADSFMLILSTIFQNMSRYAKNGTNVVIILTDELRFENIIADTMTSGTQLGLEIARTLAEQSHLKVTHHYEGEKYIVEIKKQ